MKSHLYVTVMTGSSETGEARKAEVKSWPGSLRRSCLTRLRAAGTPGTLAVMDVWREQERLVRRLGIWAAASSAAGASVMVLRRQDPVLRSFGRQTLAWGVIDGVIAGFGFSQRRRKLARLPDPHAPEVMSAELASLSRVLAWNSVADVGYLVGGGVLARAAGRGRISAARRGDGLAVLMQGAFLLWLDVASWQRLRG